MLRVWSRLCYSAASVRSSMTTRVVLSLMLLAVVALSGCKPAPPASKQAENNPAPGNGSTNSPTAFIPQTKSRIGSDDVPLLEQINRENAKVVSATIPSVVRITSIVEADPHEQLFGD